MTLDEFNTYPNITSLSKESDRPGIYCIFNYCNGRIYIGQSIRMYARWRQHCAKPRSTSKTQRQLVDKAITKAGLDNVGCRVLEYLDSRDPALLDSRERFWELKYSECRIPFGYNIVQCGSSPRNYATWIEVSGYDLCGNIVVTFPSIVQAQEAGYYITGSLDMCWRTASGMYWRYGHETSIQIEDLTRKTGRYGGRPVYQYDMKSGNFIAEYQSESVAAKTVSVIRDGTNIGQCCKGTLNYCCGYYWSFQKVENIFDIRPDLQKLTETKIAHQVIQLTLSNEFVAIYDSCVAAGKSTGLNIGNIGKCCSSGAKTHGGYRWQYFCDYQNNDQ